MALASEMPRLPVQQQPPQAPAWRTAVLAGWVLACTLPLVGLVSLLLRSMLDPKWSSPQLHFMLFLSAAAVDFALAYAAGDAARRRGDARVQLIALAFLATGAFLGLHAIGTEGILFKGEYAGFKVAIPIGLLVTAGIALASAYIDARPELGSWTIRHQTLLVRCVLGLMALWFVYTLLRLPPMRGAGDESARGVLLRVLASVGTVAFGLAAARYVRVFRRAPGLLPASIIACFVLLAESLIGVATTGERSWHASWWEWHALILTAFAVVGFAAQREWREERFRQLYLPGTRERTQDVTVLFCDLAGFTTFSERSTPAEVAAMLEACFGVATPLISRRFGGVIEKFLGDGLMATFNSRGDQPDHAARAARAALALQHEVGALGDAHPGWPRLRIGINTGEVVVRELGGHGHVAYTVLGDPVNTASRLESQAPVGGVLIGADTMRRLPRGAVLEALPGLRLKGKAEPVDAFVLRALP